MAKMAYPQFTGKLTLYRLALHDQRSAPLLQAIELQTVRATSLDRSASSAQGHTHMAGFATKPADIG
jgi:hypothetical protein